MLKYLNSRSKGSSNLGAVLEADSRTDDPPQDCEDVRCHVDVRLRMFKVNKLIKNKDKDKNGGCTAEQI